MRHLSVHSCKHADFVKPNERHTESFIIRLPTCFFFVFRRMLQNSKTMYTTVKSTKDSFAKSIIRFAATSKSTTVLWFNILQLFPLDELDLMNNKKKHLIYRQPDIIEFDHVHVDRRRRFWMIFRICLSSCHRSLKSQKMTSGIDNDDKL